MLCGGVVAMRLDTRKIVGRPRSLREEFGPLSEASGW